MTKTPLVFGTVAVLLAVTACSATDASPDSSQGALSIPDVVSFAIAADPGDLNPVLNATSDSTQLGALAYETLVLLPSGSPAEPMLAAEWTQSPTELVFTLAEGALCSDGSELVASDVANTIEYVADPETGSPYSGVYVPAGTSVSADDAAGIVTVTFDTPQSFGLESVGSLPIICAAGLVDTEALDTATFGTGPYVLAESQPGLFYTYTLRDDYGTIDVAELPASVEIQVVTDTSTQVNLLQSGELNLALVGGADRDRLDGAGFATVDVAAAPGRLFFNEAEGRATASQPVRMALANAIDRAAVGSVSTSGRGVEMNSLLSPTSPLCVGADSGEAIPEFDVEAASAALDAEGWALDDSGMRSKDGQSLSLKLLYNVNGGAGGAAGVELVQAQLAEIGVEVVLSPSDAYTDVIFAGGDWDIVWAPISAEWPSIWAGILSGDFPPNGGNWTYNANDAYHEATAAAQQLAGAESCELWDEAERALFAAVDVLPLWEGTDTYYGDGLTVDVTSTGIFIATSIRAA